MRAMAFVRLSRLHKPVGAWLLAAPCWIGLAFARLSGGLHAPDIALAALFGLGAVAMRGAGCTYNDMLDRDLDIQVARTANRPLASREVGLVAAGAWVFAQCLIGLAVLVCLPSPAHLMALASLPMVALYPLMKRVTNLPQVWLGLTFNWGVLVAVVAATGTLRPHDMIVYVALAAWTVGYDTIYALQDRADDERIGVGSTARLFGAHARTGVAVCYAIAASGLIAAVWAAGIPLAIPGVAAFAACLAWQVVRLTPEQPRNAAALFAFNGAASGVLIVAWAVTGVVA